MEPRTAKGNRFLLSIFPERIPGPQARLESREQGSPVITEQHLSPRGVRIGGWGQRWVSFKNLNFPGSSRALGGLSRTQQGPPQPPHLNLGRLLEINEPRSAKT